MKKKKPKPEPRRRRTKPERRSFGGVSLRVALKNPPSTEDHHTEKNAIDLIIEKIGFMRKIQRSMVKQTHVSREKSTMTKEKNDDRVIKEERE